MQIAESPVGATGREDPIARVSIPQINAFLSRLHGVRQRGPGRWVARCPAHADRNPSLSITITKTGKLLFHCHAGCTPGAVLRALGLTWADVDQPTTRKQRDDAQVLRRVEDLRWQLTYWLAGWLRDHDIQCSGLSPEAWLERKILAPYMRWVEWGDWELDRLTSDDWLPAAEEVLQWATQSLN